ncbi:MAG: PilZ domain-containing protein, partial [Terracidiphilus sp.]
MSEVLEFAHAVTPSNERRQHARQRLRSLTYAELDQGNGGIVLDASESGISVHAVVPLTDDVIPRLRLKLPDASAWLETRARVVWTLDSGKVAGLLFEDLPGPARDQIREWLSSEATSEGEAGYPATPTEHDVQPAPLDSHIQGARAGIEHGDQTINTGHPVGTPEVLLESVDPAAVSSRNAVEPVESLLRPEAIATIVQLSP